MTSTHQAYLAEQIYAPFKIRNLVCIAQDSGIASQDTLHGTGLTSDDLDQVDCKVSLRQLAKTYNNLQIAGTDDLLGLRIGQRLGPIQYGVYGISIASSQTMGRGLDVVFSFGELEMPAVRMGFAVDPEMGHVHFENTDNLAQPDIRHKITARYNQPSLVHI